MKRSIKLLDGQVELDDVSFRAAMDRVAKALTDDPHHRLYSWDHSHAVWKAFLSGSASEDHTTLSLAFYLASWGMYRGSSDLLFRDYKVLTPTVVFLKEAAHPRSAWTDCLFSDENPDPLSKRIAELAGDLKKALVPKLKRPDVPSHHPQPSDILLSKILLNTLGCVPAFDTEVKRALEDLLPNYTAGDAFRLPVLKAVGQLARANRTLIEKGQGSLREKCGVLYPLTKVLDLYLWIHGNSIIAKTSKS